MTWAHFGRSYRAPTKHREVWSRLGTSSGDRGEVGRRGAFSAHRASIVLVSSNGIDVPGPTIPSFATIVADDPATFAVDRCRLLSRTGLSPAGLRQLRLGTRTGSEAERRRQETMPEPCRRGVKAAGRPAAARY